MQHFTSVVFDERTQAGRFFAEKFCHCVIVFDLAALLFLRRERHMKVVVEIAAELRHPFELPAHALLVSFYLGERRTRNDDKRHIALSEMNDSAVEMVGEE